MVMHTHLETHSALQTIWQGAKVLKMIFANYHGNSTYYISLESSFCTKLESGSGKNRFLVISGYVSISVHKYFALTHNVISSIKL